MLGKGWPLTFEHLEVHHPVAPLLVKVIIPSFAVDSSSTVAVGSKLSAVLSIQPLITVGAAIGFSSSFLQAEKMIETVNKV